MGRHDAGTAEASETEIREAQSTVEIAACFPVMVELRPHLRAEDFVARVMEQQGDGYHLAFLRDDVVQAVAGYRFGRNLAWGRHMYVDDLVVTSNARSTGYGSRLMRWLLEQARAAGCAQVHLDSGVQRYAAHGFYLRHRFAITSHHFTLVLQD